MRPLYVVATVALAVSACGRSNPQPQPPTVVIVPDSFVRPSTGQPTTLAPVARGTIRLGEVDTPHSMDRAPSAVGGGPPAEESGAAAPAPGPNQAQTSVGAMSPTTVTGADSPLDSATTAPPAGGQPGNPTMTGSATAPAGPNTHGGTPAPSGR